MEWIDLLQFSTKYGVSQSTLRRRIRAQKIEFRLEHGKYLLPDTAAAVESAPLYARGLNPAKPKAQKAPIQPAIQKQSVSQAAPANTPAARTAQLNVDPVEYNHLQDELRRLQKVVAEQETLIRVLEAELR